MSDNKPKKALSQKDIPKQKLTEEEIMRMVMDLLKKIPPEAQPAALLLTVHLTNRVQRYFMRQSKRISEADAEDLTVETWMKLLAGRFEERIPPIVWLWKVARNVLIDHLRYLDAEVRADEVSINHEDYQAFAEQMPVDDDPAGLMDLTRALDAFEKLYPTEAKLLQLKAEGFTDDEIAIILNLKGGSAIRDRIHRARIKFEQFLDDYLKGKKP